MSISTDFSGHITCPLVAVFEELSSLANRENDLFEFVDTVSLFATAKQGIRSTDFHSSSTI